MAPKFVKCSVPQVSQDRPGLFCSSIPHQKIMSSRIEAGSHILFQDSFFPLIQIGVPRQGPINWHSCNLQIRTVVNTNVTTESKRLVAGSCYGKWGCVLLSRRESYAQVFLPKYLFFCWGRTAPSTGRVCMLRLSKLDDLGKLRNIKLQWKDIARNNACFYIGKSNCPFLRTESGSDVWCFERTGFSHTVLLHVLPLLRTYAAPYNNILRIMCLQTVFVA